VDIEAGVLVSGLRYLELATTLLQRMRLAESAGGIWEAAGFQPGVISCWLEAPDRPRYRN
jgi:hypothetical protein